MTTRSPTAAAVREPNKSAKVRDGVEPGTKTEPNHRKRFAFLHRRRPLNPGPTRAELPTEAERRHPTCPPGQSANKQGSCSTSAGNTASTQCSSNANGLSCVNRMDECASFRGQLEAAAAELRGTNAEVRNANCSSASAGQECGLLGQRRDSAVARYRAVQGESPKCIGAFADPFSL